MATATETKASEDLVCPSCGRTYPPNTNGPHFFALHVATCKGPVATSGRIAAREGAVPVSPPRSRSEKRNPHHRADPPRRKRSSVARKKRDYKAARARRKQRTGGGAIRSHQKVEKVTASQVMGVSPAAFIAACRAEIAKLENAIAAVEALG